MDSENFDPEDFADLRGFDPALSRLLVGGNFRQTIAAGVKVLRQSEADALWRWADAEVAEAALGTAADIAELRRIGAGLARHLLRTSQATETDLDIAEHLRPYAKPAEHATMRLETSEVRDQLRVLVVLCGAKVGGRAGGRTAFRGGVLAELAGLGRCSLRLRKSQIVSEVLRDVVERLVLKTNTLPPAPPPASPPAPRGSLTKLAEHGGSPIYL